MKISLLALVLTVALVVPAQAKKPKTLDATMVPKTDAALQALSAVIVNSESRQAQLVVRAGALQKQIAALKAKAKNPKGDIPEQLSKEDLDTFNLLNTELRYLQDAQTIEAVRQKNVLIAKEIYRASYFTATMMSEYVGEKGALDDDFDDFCRERAKAYGMEVPVELLLSVEDYVVDNGVSGKK